MLRTIPGIGKILSLVLLYEIHTIDRFPSVGDFLSYARLVTPKSPAEALASFEVATGFRIELVVAEPLVVDPVAMAFDERGCLFVVEMRDYSEQDKERLGRVAGLPMTMEMGGLIAAPCSWSACRGRRLWRVMTATCCRSISAAHFSVFQELASFDRSECPRSFVGAIRSRTNCLSCLISGKAARLGSRPNELAIDPNVKNSASTRNYRDLAQFLSESCQYFLCHPGGAKHPPTLGAIFDFHTRGVHHQLRTCMKPSCLWNVRLAFYCLDDADFGARGHDLREREAGIFEQSLVFVLGSLLAAGDEEHDEVEELAAKGFVSRGDDTFN